MTSSRALRRKVKWVKLGPDPWLATCGRCGEHERKPRMPTPVDALIRYLDAALAAHEFCRPTS